MRIVLRHRSYACDAVKGAALFISMKFTELRNSERQFLITKKLPFVIETVARAINGLQTRNVFLIVMNLKHVVGKSLEMSARMIELRIINEGRKHLLIAILFVKLADKIDHSVINDGALRMKKWNARGQFMKRKQI